MSMIIALLLLRCAGPTTERGRRLNRSSARWLERDLEALYNVTGLIEDVVDDLLHLRGVGWLEEGRQLRFLHIRAELRVGYHLLERVAHRRQTVRGDAR